MIYSKLLERLEKLNLALAVVLVLLVVESQLASGQPLRRRKRLIPLEMRPTSSGLGLTPIPWPPRIPPQAALALVGLVVRTCLAEGLVPGTAVPAMAPLTAHSLTHSALGTATPLETVMRLAVVVVVATVLTRVRPKLDQILPGPSMQPLARERMHSELRMGLGAPMLLGEMARTPKPSAAHRLHTPMPQTVSEERMPLEV
eukprot:Rmarinus@m.17016